MDGFKIFFKKLQNRLVSLYLDKESASFTKHNKLYWAGLKQKNCHSVIITDIHPMAQSHIVLSYFLNTLAKKHEACIKTYGSSQIRYLANRKVRKIYESFNIVGHVFTKLNDVQSHRASEIFLSIVPALKEKKAIFDLNFEGIDIGIDIYESYLRRFNKPTVCLSDPRLFEIIREAIDLVIFWKAFFKANDVAAVVVSHDAYVEMNILCKIAREFNVPAYVPTAQLLMRINEPFIYSYRFAKYRDWFAHFTSEQQANAKAIAKRQLERRFSGEVGVDMAYAEKSAYAHSSINSAERLIKPSEKINVLICTHCFYDNPHAYGRIYFLDFYEWLKYLVGVAAETEYNWYLKTHPDPLPGTLEIIEEILGDSGRILVLPTDASNLQLAKEGVDFVLTAYGSVGHEYPALGVPVINAGCNPHVAYDFNWHPKNLEEYENILLNLNALKQSPQRINMDDIYEFYYMHYFHAASDGIVFESYKEFIAKTGYQESFTSQAYSYFQNNLTQKHHREILENINQFVESKASYSFEIDKI